VQLRFASWIVVLGMVAVMTGCGSMKTVNGAGPTDSLNHYRLKSQRVDTAILDGITRVGISKYSPTESVKSTITELLSILGNEALEQPNQVEKRRQQIEQVIRARVDYEQMARRSLEPTWASRNDMERQEFAQLFLELLRDTIANKVDQYYDEQIFFLSEQRKGNFAEVKTKLIGSKVDAWLDFRLESQSGDWLVYDVLIDGVSVVRSYRTQFTRVIRDHAYAGLVEKMKLKTLVVKIYEKREHTIALSPKDPFSVRLLKCCP
jgi:phospholipid transport system substrate-binding protein